MDRQRAKAATPIAGLARSLPLGELLALGARQRADLTPDLLLQDVADAITRTLGFTRVHVRLRNPDTDVLEACAFAGLSDEEIARLRSEALPPAHYQALLQSGARLGDSYLIGDRAPAGPRRRAREQARQLLVPLRSHADRLIGAIYVDLPGPKAADLASVRVLEAIARQAALSLENARLAARMQRLLAKEQLLTELGREVSATLNLDQILAATSERLARAFGCAALLLLDDDGRPQIGASVGAEQHWRLHLAAGGVAAEQGAPYLSNDLAAELQDESVGLIGPSGSVIAVPLRSGGRVIGALTAASERASAFTYEDVDLLEAVAAQIGGPISGAQLYRQTQLLAEQVRRRNEHLLVINALAGLAVSTLDLERMLMAVIEQIRQGFGFDHVELYEIDAAAHIATQVANSSEFEHGVPAYHQSLDTGVLGRAYRSARTARIDDVSADPDYLGNTALTSRSELCVPVMASGRVLALLNVESRHIAAFSDADVEALETVADVIANAIENAHLSRRAQEVAVLEERSRLARDLHDSISQQLFSMTLTAQAARAQLEKNPARAATQLERLQETAAAALAEMRALIFQLRPPALSEQGLVAALQQHVASLGRREGLDVSFTVAGDERHARGVEQALYRIAQEALNNVIKHAGDCRVEVRLDLQPHEVTLTIEDHGLGFEPAATGGHGRHLGLISMRERAVELGGRFDLTSEPGRGTRIAVAVPRKG